MIIWPTDLVDDIARRKSVLFLGAGISKNSANGVGDRPKDWDEFLTLAASKIASATQKKEVLETITNKDLLTACELAKRYLQPHAFKTLLLAEYSTKGFNHAQIHDDIAALDSRYVITTNFDKLYENRANSTQNNTVIVKTYDSPDAADVLRRKERCVIKMHGTIDEPDSAIFTRSSYARARTNHADFFRVVDALFLTHTFVFLGVSMRDPDMQLLMEDQAYRFPGNRPHYMVMPNGQISDGVVTIMEESMNVHPLAYDPSNHHVELAQSLTELRPMVDAARAALIVTADW